MECGAAAGRCANTSASATTSAGLLPTLLLIGTRKGGTTALSGILVKHPHLIRPACKSNALAWPDDGGATFARVKRTMCVWDKETRYFTRGEKAGVDLCWYRSLYRCAGSADSRVGFDGSPDYLTLEAPQVSAMAAVLGPRARVVAILRNPSDRFYSAYNMAWNERPATLEALRTKRTGAPAVERRDRRGRPTVTYEGFAESLDRMIACAPNCTGEPNVVRMFFRFGLYAQHLRPYLAAFGRESVLVEKSEDFYADAWPVVARVLTHAGLPQIPEEIIAAERAKPIDKVTNRNSGGVWGGAQYKGRLLPTERRKLGAYYSPHNRELYELIARDMGWEAEDAATISQQEEAERARRAALEEGPRLRPEL